MSKTQKTVQFLKDVQTPVGTFKKDDLLPVVVTWPSAMFHDRVWMRLYCGKHVEVKREDVQFVEVPKGTNFWK